MAGCVVHGVGVGRRVMVSELPIKAMTEVTPRGAPGSFCPARPGRCPGSADAGAVFAELIRVGLQQRIGAEFTATIGVGRCESGGERTVHRNGHRPMTVSTASGDVEVQIPSCASGHSSRAAEAAAPYRQGPACGNDAGICPRSVDA